MKPSLPPFRSVIGPLVAVMLALSFWLFWDVSGVMAAAGPWAENDQSRVRLIAASDAVGEGAEVLLGVQFELQPGWKTYWRTPGEAGYPPRLDWSASENLAQTRLDWPAPHRFSLFGLETFGYTNEVIFPVTARLERDGEAVALRATVDYLLCEEICIPYSETLSLDLPAGPATPSAEAFSLDRFRAQVPTSGAASGMILTRVALAEQADKLRLEAALSSTLPMVAPDLLVEGPNGWAFGKPEVQIAADGLTARLALPVYRGTAAEGDLPGQTVTLTAIDGRRALQETVALTLEGAAGGSTLGRTAAEGAPGPLASRGLLAILALAVLGGLILNLMPCVLPVLSIKLLSAVGHGGRESGLVRLSFLASAAGILFSFLALAAVAIGLKTAGLAVGWGIQFQQPAFLALMALIVTLFACNLFGFFEIGLPGWMSGVATAHDSHSLTGHFLTGAFATLLATPCSAPFLGTAVGFALSRGPVEILAVFLALGVGLALPYLLVAAVPSLATKLPRPGAWMILLRRLLGLALVATAVWLLSVLAAQVGALQAAAVAGLLVLLGLAVALRRWLGRERAGAERAGAGSLLVASLAGLAALGVAVLPSPRGAETEVAAATEWLPLDEAVIARRVAAGEVIFVDVTADWCITCQVNKSLVIDREPVSDLLGGGSVVAMRGDWTLPDDRIARYLASFGRYGIPFNAVYGPAEHKGIALPELLGADDVLVAIQRASGDKTLARSE